MRISYFSVVVVVVVINEPKGSQLFKFLNKVIKLMDELPAFNVSYIYPLQLENFIGKLQSKFYGTVNGRVWQDEFRGSSSSELLESLSTFWVVSAYSLDFLREIFMYSLQGIRALSRLSPRGLLTSFTKSLSILWKASAYSPGFLLEVFMWALRGVRTFLGLALRTLLTFS